jgi:hypothetical protein
MINLKKEEALEVKHVYCLSAKEYTADYADGAIDDGVHPYSGKCVMGIYKEDFEALKEAGFPCKEYTQIILASSEYDNMKDISKHTVRQAMFKHIVYVDKVDHTNF